MKSLKLAVMYGFISWVIPFIVAMLIFPLWINKRQLFESIITVALAFSVMILAYWYLRDVPDDFPWEGIFLGALWFVINFAIDLFTVYTGADENGVH